MTQGHNDDDDSSCSDDEKQTATIQSSSSEIIVAVGTYDGSIAAFEVKSKPNQCRLDLMLAAPVHDGSVRSLAFSHHPTVPRSCIMVSTGYDDVMKPHDFATRRLSTGDIRTTSIAGTPTVAVFAPPPSRTSTMASSHCLVGFGEPSGQLVLYKRNAKWTAQHILKGHDGGIASLAVHPSGKLAISGGRRDGKLKVWDLERGRLAYASPKASRLQNTSITDGGATLKHYECIDCIVWKPPAGGEDETTAAAGAADCYAFSYGSHITVRTTLTGQDLLDVDLPSKVNEVCLMDGPQGLFVAAACNDGSLPVLCVEEDGRGDTSARRAIMAMEPADGKERFKFIKHVSQYRVVVASSTGVVHFMDLKGAVNMIMNPQVDAEETEEANDKADEATDNSADGQARADTEEEEEELAVEILDAQMVGSGVTRISSLAIWMAPATSSKTDTTPAVVVEEPFTETTTETTITDAKKKKNSKSDKSVPVNKRKAEEVELDEAAMEKARSLVSKAKKIQKKRNKQKNNKTSS
jgi:WD40 repeat protein